MASPWPPLLPAVWHSSLPWAGQPSSRTAPVCRGEPTLDIHGHFWTQKPRRPEWPHITVGSDSHWRRGADLQEGKLQSPDPNLQQPSALVRLSPEKKSPINVGSSLLLKKLYLIFYPHQGYSSQCFSGRDIDVRHQLVPPARTLTWARIKPATEVRTLGQN